MLLTIGDVLDLTELREIRREAKASEFRDGRLTAGYRAKKVKKNEQVGRNLPERDEKRPSLEYHCKRQNCVVEPQIRERLRMMQVLPSLIQRNTRAQRKNQNRDDKAPEVDLLAVAEGKIRARRLVGLLEPVEQQHLIAGIHHGMDALREHGGAAAERGSDELRDRNETVSDQGGVDCSLGRRGHS